MSHFKLMVIGADPAIALRPFHQFECTGTNDEFVIDIDVTLDKLAEYNKDTVKCLRSPLGVLTSKYDDTFYRDPTPEETKKNPHMLGAGWSNDIHYTSKDWGDGKGYRAKVQFIPAGYTEVEVPLKDRMTFFEYLTDYCGMEEQAVEVDGVIDIADKHKFGHVLYEQGEVNGVIQKKVMKVISRTNPNYKWDWWVVGGRYANGLRLKRGKTGVSKALTVVQSANPWDDDRVQQGYANSALKGDIDWDTTRKEAALSADKYWKKIRQYAPDGWESWDSVRSRIPNIDEARTYYHDQPGKKALFEASKNDKSGDLLWVEDDVLVPRTQYMKTRAAAAGMPFAFLKDGVWSERGEMLMFGMVANETNMDEWLVKAAEMIEALPDDTLITVVDCHI